MTDGWNDAFLGFGGADAGGGREAPESGRGCSRVCARTSGARAGPRQGLAEVAFDPQDAGVWERLEEALLLADVGVPATVVIVERLEAEAAAGRLQGAEALGEALRDVIAEMLETEPERRKIDVRARPAVVLSSASTAPARRRRSASSPTASRGGGGAWSSARPTRSAPPPPSSSRPGPRGPRPTSWLEAGADPAAVAFDAVSAGEARGRDVVIIDTAGRLHTQEHLMEELAKVRRVVAQRLPGAPHETLLSIDATTGQNGLQQARRSRRRPT